MFRRKNRERATSAGVDREPRPIAINTPDDAEVAAAEWLRYWGFSDVIAFPGGGPDGGVDLRGSGIVGQVKATRTPIGRPVVQQIFGIAAAEGALAAVFSLSGYSNEAVVWADRTGVMLFEFDLQGRPGAANWRAWRLKEPTANEQQLSNDVRADIDALVRMSGEILDAGEVFLREVQENLEDERRRLSGSTYSNLTKAGIDPTELGLAPPNQSADAEARTTQERVELKQAFGNFLVKQEYAASLMGRLVHSREAMDPTVAPLWRPHIPLIFEAGETVRQALLLPTISKRMAEWDRSKLPES